MIALPSTIERVPLNTDQEQNERIWQQTEQYVFRVGRRGRAAIDRRLQELEEEWDIERLLETNAATAVLVGVTLATAVDKRFFVLPALVAGFLLQHAVQGWCPPVPLFRRWGFRTQSEIDEERYALKVLRGDFYGVEPQPKTSESIHLLLAAVRR
jgi:hypothetical protein